MKMNVPTIGWFVIMILIKNFSHVESGFELLNRSLSASEGSCIEIKCEVTYTPGYVGAYWFWMKDPRWNYYHKKFIATIIYSTNTLLRPVNPDYATRVKYAGTPPYQWNSYTGSKKFCSILICDLKITDSGNYAFRFLGKPENYKWVTANVTLKVKGNPCLVTFENPPNGRESNMMTLTCYTSDSCPSNPQIQGLTRSNYTNHSSQGNRKSVSVSFTANWEDDGKTFSCQTQDNRDPYLICYRNVTVHYLPQVEIKMISPSSTVRQGDKITLECATIRSNPLPHVYYWYKNGEVTGESKSMFEKRVEPEDSGVYICSAFNNVQTGSSRSLSIQVQYSPRETSINISGNDNRVKVNESLRFTCKTDAYPLPEKYSWYRYNETKQTDSSNLMPLRTYQELILEHIKLTDEGCYVCEATNIIDTGEKSQPLCIQVKYPPTNVLLSMETEVTEGQLITINCTVQSFPPSRLTLARSSTLEPWSSDWHFTQTDIPLNSNSLLYTFHVNSTHPGFYSCRATNSEGSTSSTHRKLVVRYAPTDVLVEAQTGLIVNENASLVLSCSARSYPPVILFAWVKVTDGKREIVQNSRTINISSVSLSDSGLYSCSATNDIGTGNSQRAEVKVKYAPKYATMRRETEQQHPDGTSSVTLSCSSHSYPPIKRYSWYKKTKAEERDTELSGHQNLTVNSNQPGIYYCIAANEINQTSSDQVQLFGDRGFLNLLFLLLIVLPVVLFLVYRYKRSKSVQGSANSPPPFGFLVCWTCTKRKDRMNETVTGESSRSKDDLLPDQPTPSSSRKHGPVPKKPRELAGGTEDEDLNYASLKFRNVQKNIMTVYAAVSKQGPRPQSDQESLGDYENINAAHTATSPNPLICSSDVSEVEIELNYSEVNFRAMPVHERGIQRDPSTSDEEESQYSVVKI